MKYYTRIGDVEREYRFERRGGELIAHCGDRVYTIDATLVGDGTAMSLLVDGSSYDLILERSPGGGIVQLRGRRIAVEVMDERERAAKHIAGARSAGPQEVHAVMPGVVVEILVAEGDRVEPGQTLLVLEAMKMQNPLQTDTAGVVRRLAVKAGQAVAGGALLVLVEPEAP